MRQVQKQYFIVGLMGMFALIILGAIFFRERIAFSDTAFQSVFLLIEQKPLMNWVRPGSMIPQLLPLMAIWAHAGLRTVMVLHSISFLILFLVMYLLAYSFSARRLLFFITPLYLVLITNEVFYWPQSELQQGMLWLCLYAVLLWEGRWKTYRPWLYFLLHFLFIVWVQFFHPLIFFPIVFLVIYYYDKEHRLLSWRGIGHLIICLAAFAIRNVVGMSDAYEKDRLSIGTAIRANLPHFFSLDAVQVFIAKLPSAYSVYMSFLLVGMVWLLMHKKYIRAGALAVFSVGYWALVMVAYPVDGRFYTENMLLPLGFIAALPFAADIIPSARVRYAPLIFLLIISIRLGYIYQAHTDYTEHYTVYDPYIRYVRQHRLNGVFVDNKLIDQKKAIATWASGYEVILMTSLASPDSCIVVQADYDIARYGWVLGADSSLVTIYGTWGQSRLPARYFRLRRGRYEAITEPL